jgi:S1-C subfamily serine protease
VPSPTGIVIPPGITDEQAVLVNLYSRVDPAVVNITDYAKQSGEMAPFGQGSGFVYDSAGHIVTNAHVVEGTEQLDVTFSDGTILPAKIVGEDLHSDLAVIKVDRLPEGVGPLPLGDINNLAVGQTVVAIGNPFGLEGTLTRGIISALGRKIPALTLFSIPQVIQTDAAINPGNSGGPLLNLQGEVIGVNAQIASNSTNQANSGVGFAIPVSILKLVVPELINKGTYEWAWLGVRGGDLSPTMAQANNTPIDRGAYISEVVSGGPADKAGMRGSSGTKTIEGRSLPVGGDVIVSIDGQIVRSFDDILLYIAMQTKPGQTVTLSIYRDGKLLDLQVILEARPASLTNQ